MGVHSLIKAALHPGTTLQHHGEKIVPVDALHALALAPAKGSVLIHARIGQENLAQLEIVVQQVALQIFAERNWTIHGRRMNPTERMRRFCEQVWREYMGEPCRRCKGHGWVGRKLDLVRHRLGTCESCQGRGFVIVQTKSSSVETRSTLLVRKPCSTCRGKRLVEVVEELKAKRLRQCPACWGSGSVPATMRARARALRYDHKHVGAVWMERFRAVLMALRNYERDALIICREQLYGPE